MAKSAEQVVLEFCSLWEKQDVDGVVAAMTPDCTYANVPLPAMHGHDEVRSFITNLLTTTSKVEFIIHNIATGADGVTVFTERTDAFSMDEKRFAAPVMGIFVVRNDLIHEWRDYCDLTAFVTEMRKMGFSPATQV
jgi:limonene-1,2-epoxide hydrolase